METSVKHHSTGDSFQSFFKKGSHNMKITNPYLQKVYQQVCQRDANEPEFLNAGAEVLGVASIFAYGMQKGLDRMREANVTNYSLSNLDALVEVAAEEGYIKPEDKARLIAFRNNPSDESWMQ